MDEEHRIEMWSICERYKNYKSTNYYKEPLQFRPHPQNVVRDVFMYRIFHNEGKICNDALIQYIKNKIVNDLNEIFMLYEYAPDAISMINRLMSSKRHLGTEETYNEMIFHALTIRDARDILIEQITNVLIKCIPVPLGNIKFDVIMKDNVKDIVNNINKSHKQTINNKEGESVMKGNPQNIEVGDIVSFTSIGDQITSVVLSICDQGCIGHGDENSIDGYLVRATVMNKGTVCNYPVKELTIVRKWHVTSITAESTLRGEVKEPDTYRFVVTSCKTKETLKVAVKLISDITDDDIDFSYENDNIVSVNKNFIDNIVWYVGCYSDNDFTFDGKKDVFVDGDTELSFQNYIDEELDPIIVTVLKQKMLSAEHCGRIHVNE